MKVLFVRERWADGRQEFGDSDGNYMIPTAKESGHVAVTFFWDDPAIQADKEAALRERVKSENPDLIMFSVLISWGENNIKRDLWAELRKTSKVVGVWHEGVAPDVVRWADTYADVVDLNLFIDTETQFLQWTKRPDKCLGLFDPRSPIEFHPAPKSIPILFNGTFLNRGFRPHCCAYLLSGGVPVTKIGGRSELFVQQEQMVRMLASSHICLNFSDAGQFRHYKGRVAEALLSGAMLLEWDNADVNSILTPFVHFVPFVDHEDCLQKAKHYLNHAAEREKIAAAGRARGLEVLDGRLFWKRLEGRLNQ